MLRAYGTRSIGDLDQDAALLSAELGFPLEIENLPLVTPVPMPTFQGTPITSALWPITDQNLKAWAYIGGGLAFLWWITGERSKRQEYAEAKAKIRRKYSTSARLKRASSWLDVPE